MTVMEVHEIVTCYTKSDSAVSHVFEKLNASGIPLITVGGTKSPRNLHAAVKEGAMFSVKQGPDYFVTNSKGAHLDDLPTKTIADSLLHPQKLPRFALSDGAVGSPTSYRSQW